jgi:hypothetical protein
MTRTTLMLVSAGALAFLGLLVGRWASPPDDPALFHSHASHAQREPAPLCPWRESERDLRRFFPGATATREELRIMSHLRIALIQNLGRPLTAEELLLRGFRVMRRSQPLGTVLVRPVKGEFGAIELVLAVEPEGRVRGLRLQRQREPAPIVAELTASRWLGAFRGKTADSPLRIGQDLPQVSRQARISAAAVAEGVRSLLILLRAAQKHGRDGRSAA